MDLRQLRYFLEIVNRRSISAAAESLRVAQPALSLHVKNMEAALGTKLLIRGRSGVEPTEAGRLLAARARVILDQMTRTQDDIRSLESDPTGVVRIGLPGTIAGLVALPLIQAARAQYPNITLNILEAMSGFVWDWLKEGRVDIAVLYNASAEQGFASEWLLDEELVLVDAPSGNRPDRLSLADMDQMDMVLPSQAHGLRMLIDRAFADIGITPRIAVEIDAYASIKSLAAAGYGASILPYHAVAEDCEKGVLNASHIKSPGLKRRVHMVVPTHRPTPRAQAVVRDLLRQVIHDLVRRADWQAAQWRAGPA